MLRQVGPLGSFKVAAYLIRHLWLDWLLAGVLCAFSVPLNPLLAEKLAPDVLLPIWGIAVSVFIGFRHGQAYERWWEARKLWGALLNHSRSWRDQLRALLVDPAPPLLQQQAALVWVINLELRGSSHPAARRALLALDWDGSKADALLQAQAKAVAELYRSGAIDGWGRLQLMEVHSRTSDALGGLERIRNHPLPAPYDVFVRVAVWSFGYLLFLRMDALYAPYGGWVGWVVMLLFIAVERLGAFIETPFSPADLALPMNRISATVSRLLLSNEHPAAQMPDSEQALIWT